jgi:hypothetical protein
LKTHKASREFETAIKRDCAWFQPNPFKTRLRRKITHRELLRELRGLGIVEVVIEGAGPDRFIRTSFDHSACAIATSIDHLKDTVVPVLRRARACCSSPWAFGCED